MLNLLPQIEPQAAPEPVFRLGSLHNALRLVDEHGGGPASDFDIDEAAADWAVASEADRRCLDRRSADLLAAASAGLELVVGHRALGSDVSPAALEMLAEEIRSGLEDIERLLRA